VVLQGSDAISITITTIQKLLMIMVLCPKAGSLAFTPPGDEMSEVVPLAFLTENYG